MTHSHEGEVTIFADSKGNPAKDPKKSALIEVEYPDGTTGIMIPEGSDRDPFEPRKASS